MTRTVRHAAGVSAILRVPASDAGQPARAGSAWWLWWLLAWPAAGLAVHLGGLAVKPTDLASLLWLLLAAPLLEELALRPLLQEGLARQIRAWGWRAARAERWALVVVCLVFVLAHALRLPAQAPWWWPLAWLLPGWALGHVWAWRKRVADCVALHAHFNLVIWLWSPG